MDIKKRVRLKLFVMDLAFEIVVNSIILIVAWFSNRFIETLLFYISWAMFRYAVPKVFHIKHFKKPLMNVIGCAICSIACFVISIRFMLPISMSIFSSVVVGIWINYILYLLADYRDLRIAKSKNTIDIYKMTENELRNYAHSQGLSEMIVDTLILKVIHNYRWSEISKERNYTKEGVRYHKQRIQKVLNIKL